MSITTTAIAGGSYGADIVYTAGETLASVKGAVETWITGHGWELVDAAAGTNAIAYRHLLPGGTPGGSNLHYAWIVLDYNTTGYLILRLYEAWNTTLDQYFVGAAHTGLNKATNDRSSDDSSIGEPALAQRIDLTSGGSLRVISRLNLWLYSTISAGSGSSTGNGATGVFFRTRDVSSDTVGVSAPSSVCANSALFFAMGTTFGYNHFSLPRSWDGSVGVSPRCGVSCAVAALALPKIASQRPSSTWGSYGFADSSASFFGANPASTLEMLSDVRVAVFAVKGVASPYEWLGRITNMAAVLSGSVGSTGSVKLDGSGIPSAGGTAVPMVQLPHSILVAY
jgi:hypothetical protein